MLIDINFNFYFDARGGDPDSTSPTLRKYHKILWSKPLPNGEIFELTNNRNGAYLYHNSGLGEFILGSDAITHSYKNQKIKFYLPFDDFKTKPTFADIDEYLVYKKGVMNFIRARNKRIENFANQLTSK